MLRNFIKKLLHKATLPVLSGPIKGFAWILRSGVLGYWTGRYEKIIQKELEKFIKRDDVFLDIGAHVGFFSLLGARLVGPKGKIFSFEPNLDNLFYLKRHVALNNIDNIKIIDAAVSSAEKRSLLFKHSSSFMSSLRPLDFSSSDSEEVSVVALDAQFEKGVISPPNIIKIDVEGEEYEVLLGGKNLIKKYKPRIILSIHGRDLAFSCVDFLKKLGYSIYSPYGISLDSFEGGEVVAYFERS